MGDMELLIYNVATQGTESEQRELMRILDDGEREAIGNLNKIFLIMGLITIITIALMWIRI